ncbi:MAG: NAD(P)-dependent alcohol dehydrogenase [Anaerolineae bacterium]|nr:NAD(P)-dependent alcohol dehydrogenase [Anaerolineae bacterium]
MRAHGYAALQQGATLEPYEYDLAALGPNEVRIKVSHCGICHSDVHVIDEWAKHYPVVPGHEVVGIVTEIGSQVRTLTVGQRVGVGWQAESCLACEWCLRGEENLCRNSVATCVDRPGGFADLLQIDHRFAYAIPDNLSSENAAPLLCAGVTVYAPLHRLADSSARVGVIGIGGLGHLALQFAAAFGCEVAAFSTTPDKEAEARAFGATRFIVSTDATQMKQATASLDLILCTVNVALDWGLYTRCLRPNGILCFVGALNGKIEVPFGHLMQQKSVTGSSIGSRIMMREMLTFAARHGIVAQTEAIPMNEVNAAIEKVRHNQARYRMVLTQG